MKERRREKKEGGRWKREVKSEGERGKETEIEKNLFFKTGFKASHQYNLVLTKNTV